MKILYIAKERRAAELAAFALPAVAPDVTVGWAASLADARRWVDENRDVGTIIVEVESDVPSCESFIRQVHDWGVMAPVVVVSVSGSVAALPALESIADQVIPKKASFLNELPAVVSRALDTARPSALSVASGAAPVRRDLALVPQLVAAGRGRSDSAGGGLPRGPRDRQPNDDRDARLERTSDAHRTLDRRLSDAAAAIDQARKDHAAEAKAWGEYHEQQDAETAARLAEAADAREHVEQQLADIRIALSRANDRAAEERRASQELARRHAELETQYAHDVAERRAVEAKLAEAEAARESTEQQRVADAAAAAAHLAQREAELASRLDQAASVHEQLEQRLTDADAALRYLEHRGALDRQQAAERQTAVESELEEAEASRQRLEQELSAAGTALQDAEERHASELDDARERFRLHQQQADVRLAEANAAIAGLHSGQVELNLTLDTVRQEAETDRNAAAAKAAELQLQFEAEVTQGVARQQALQQALAAAEAEHARVERRHASDVAAFEQRLADNQRHAETRLAESAEAIATLEERLTESTAALGRAYEEAAADRQEAAERALQRQAEFEGRIASEAARSQALVEQLKDAESSLQLSDQHHAAEMTAAIARLDGYQKQSAARLAQASAALNVLKTKLADAAETLQRAEQRADAERQSAVAAAAERQAEFDAEFSREVAAREQLARQLTLAEAVHRDAIDRHTSELAIATARLTAYQAGAEDQLAESRAVADALRAELATLRADLHRVERQAAIDQDAAAQLAERQLADAVARLRQSAREQEAQFEARIAERDTQLHEQAARHEASAQLAATAVSDVEGRLRQTLDAQARDGRTIEKLKQQLSSLEGELGDARRHGERLKAEADLVPQLRKQMDETGAQHQRDFDQSPVTMCRLGPDGEMQQATRALAGMLGYGTVEAVRQRDFAAAVFENADDLKWLIDRCLATRTAESIETRWKKQDGTRIVVCLLAVATDRGSIDLAVQDVTALRELEEKLRNSQRMEAVGRYASEVAVTCGTLLENIKDETRRWLASSQSETAGRRHGPSILEEVTRASEFLQQLAVYGEQHKNVPELVDAQKVLHDLGPVLKRVAGNNIEFVLPKASGPQHLDVEIERIERILVNVAAYGRERMPSGGRLMFELASVVLDRAFVEKYPNVRPGAHVRLTVTEKRAVRQDHAAPDVQSDTMPAGARPGVDLGILQMLVSDCGGHLWMTVEPPGDMVLKIHLPRRPLDGPDQDSRKRHGARWIERLAGSRRE